MSTRGRILVLWNQTEEDIYEQWRDEGPKALEWSPERKVPDVGTVAEEMTTFLEALTEGGFEVEVVNVEDDLERLLSAIRLYRPDAVFNLVEYFNDDQVQEGYIAGIYELLGLPYTGNRPITLATCQNKFRTKLILEATGLPTAAYFRVEKEPIPDAVKDYKLEFPLICKPAYEDASGGIEHASVVRDQAELEVRVRHVLEEFSQPVLVEEYIASRLTSGRPYTKRSSHSGARWSWP
jgi:D-alanine-D-alanine ligase